MLCCGRLHISSTCFISPAADRGDVLDASCLTFDIRCIYFRAVGSAGSRFDMGRIKVSVSSERHSAARGFGFTRLGAALQREMAGTSSGTCRSIF